jgi:hypothetical protein
MQSEVAMRARMMLLLVLALCAACAGPVVPPSDNGDGPRCVVDDDCHLARATDFLCTSLSDCGAGELCFAASGTSDGYCAREAPCAADRTALTSRDYETNAVATACVTTTSTCVKGLCHGA